MFEDAERAGRSSVTLVEGSLEDRLSDLKTKAIEIRDTSESDSVKTAIIADPDGISSSSRIGGQRDRELVVTRGAASTQDRGQAEA